MWRILILAIVAGVSLGAARAWWDVGAFDAAGPLSAFDFPTDDEPDYWVVPEGRQAKAAFDSLRYEFGKLEVGRTMRHVFRVTNEGDFPLVLAERESSCICTIANLADRPIPPGETAEVMLEWNAPAKARPGEPYRQWTAIDTNDQDQPSVTLVVEGELAAPVAVQSPVLSFGTVAASQTRTLSTSILSYRAADAENPTGDRDPLAIAATNFDDATTAKFFDVQIVPLPASELGETGASGGLRLSVTLKPGLPDGPFHQTIRLRTNLAEVVPVAVSLVGEIGPDAYVTGPGYSRRTNVLNLGRIDPSRGVERKLTLVVFAMSSDAPAPNVAQATPAELAAEIGPALAASDDGSRRWPLTVRLGPLDEQNNATNLAEKTGRIVVATGHGTVERVEIEVKFSVATQQEAK